MREPEVRQRLAAILAADVAGYSRLMAGDDKGTVADLDVSRAVFREAVSAQGGRIVDTAGDSVLAVFETATGALRAAIAAQSEINRTAKSIPEDRRMLFRIGVTLGEVIEKPDGTVYGDGVNIAARLEAASQPGGITISGTAYDHVHNRVDIGYQDLGTLEVKNIPEPVQAYRVETDNAALVTETVSPLKLSDKPSIVVLPFDNMSGDTEQEYFADGITEDIITGLSRFNGLFVIARNTSMTFKGQKLDVRDVATQLGVRYVMEGSVRKLGARVRITAQLVDGLERDHIWAERYDGSLDDLFELQEEVTGKVVASIGTHITEFEIGRTGRDERYFDEAHDLAWRARKALYEAVHRGEAALSQESINLANRAVQANPNCLLAYITLCNICFLRRLYRWTSDPAKDDEIAERAAREMMAELLRTPKHTRPGPGWN